MAVEINLSGVHKDLSAILHGASVKITLTENETHDDPIAVTVTIVGGPGRQGEGLTPITTEIALPSLSAAALEALNAAE